MGFCIENTLLDVSLTGGIEATESAYELRNGRDNFDHPDFSVDLQRTMLPVLEGRLGVGPEFRTCDKKMELDVMLTGSVQEGSYSRSDPVDLSNADISIFTKDQLVDQQQLKVGTHGVGGVVRFSYLPFESARETEEVVLDENYVPERNPWDIGVALGFERQWESYYNEYGAIAFDASYNLYNLDSQPLVSPKLVELYLAPNFGPFALATSGSFYGASQKMRQLEGMLGGKPEGSLGPNGFYGSSGKGSRNPVAVGPAAGKSDWQVVLQVDAAKAMRMIFGKGQSQLKAATTPPEDSAPAPAPKDLDGLGLNE